MRKPIRPCLHHGCGNYTEASYCHLHAPPSTSPTTAVSQSRDHRRKRERLVRQGAPWICVICGGLIHSADDMHLHHVVSVARGGGKGKTGPAHALCNRRRGARAA